MAEEGGKDKTRSRIVRIHLDEKSVVRRNPDVEHERAIAIFDLLEGNYFAPAGDQNGPYILRLSIEEDRLVIAIHDESEAPRARINVPTLPFRKLIRDYFTVCESYYQAIRTASPSRIEAIDMGRRSLHDEAAGLLRERLAGKIEIDLDTARRLFTLICVLHIRG